ncbi:MAG: hypothetical protein LBN38_06005 [Verrucomicrobiota bacterium]|jgi:hypothetical protein|nr:hypothetical protein [Verrucomicrobiota bacterium]
MKKLSSPDFRVCLSVVVCRMVLPPQGSPFPWGTKISSGAPEDFFGGAILQRLMGSAVLVQPNGFGLCLRPKAPSQYSGSKMPFTRSASVFS